MTSTTDPDGNTASTAYDAVGRTLSVTYPAVEGVSFIESYSYDDQARIVTVTDPRGQQTRDYFDGLGRMIEVQAMNGSSVHSSTYYTYNWLDKEASVQVPSGFTYYFAYDQAGRPVKETFPDGSSATASYSDDLSVVTVKDQDGHRTFYVYDLGGRLKGVEQYSTSTQSFVTNYFYDGVGNLLLVGNNIGQLTSYQYDDLNRLVKTTGPDGNATTYSYDALGNLVGKKTPNGAAIGYAYDQANRLVSMQYPDGSQTSFTYDPDGNTLTVASTLSGSTAETYAYDSMNRVSSSALTVAGSTYTTSYSYDVAGNPVKVTYPNGLAVPMSYDAVGRLKAVGSYATFAYSVDDGVTSIAFGDGEVQTYTYDSRDRPTSIVDASGNKKLLSLAYTYDKASNILGISGASFTYDNMSRVVSTKAGSGTESYTYDGAGNILSSASSGKNSATVYKGCGFYPNSLSGTVVQCGTDRDGNIVAKTGGWSYSYNFEDEMVAAAVNGMTQQTNVYDGLGNRVQKTEGGASTVFTYQGVNLLFEKELGAGATTNHIYGDGMQLAKVVGGTTYYYHEDQVGSNQLVTYADPHNGKASTSFSSSYEPYGANYQAKGTETFQYTDRMLDSATGLYYFNARFYDPSIMRFDTRDPAPGNQHNPATLNPYAYAGGNPMSNIDPAGTDWNPFTWLLFGAVVGLTAVSALQFGLDVGTDALDAAAISELLGQIGLAGATLSGMPMIALQALSSEEAGIAVELTPDEFAALVTGLLESKQSRLATGYVQERAAAILSGTTNVRAIRTPISSGGRWEGGTGLRWFDIEASNRKFELKFAGDPVSGTELKKDVWLRTPGFGGTVPQTDVWYLFIGDPNGKFYSRADIDNLNFYGIPYMSWTWNEFLRMWDNAPPIQ